MTMLRVAVVGAGIGGVAAAVGLRHLGIDVQLYEQAPVLTEVGAGVTIHPNGMRALDSLGVGHEAIASAAPHDDSWARATDGTVLNHETNTGWGLHRADLLDILVRQLPERVIHLGHRLRTFDQDGPEVRLQFEDEASVTADVLVAADGIHSVAQHAVVEDAEPPRFSHTMAYRSLVGIERVPDWPAATVQMWAGDRQHLRVYPIRGGRLLNLIAVVPADNRVAESWTGSGDPDVFVLSSPAGTRPFPTCSTRSRRPRFGACTTGCLWHGGHADEWRCSVMPHTPCCPPWGRVRTRRSRMGSPSRRCWPRRPSTKYPNC